MGSCVADLVFHPCQAFAHRLGRDEVRERDLLGRQAAGAGRVSATCASSASAGWQQVKMSSSRSSGKVADSCTVASDSTVNSRASEILDGRNVVRGCLRRAGLFVITADPPAAVKACTGHAGAR